MKTLLSSHTLRVSKKKDSKDSSPPQYYMLDNIPINNNLFDFLQDFFRNHQTPADNTQQQTYMRVRNFNVNDRMLFGIMERGVYGIRSDVVDVKSHTLSYKKKETDADVLPFYFLISLPKNTDEGIILFQRTGTHGFQSTFTDFLKRAFRSKFPLCDIHINNLMLEEFVRKNILRGSITELKCVKYRTSIDIADDLLAGHQEIPGDIELAIKAKRIPLAKRINEFFDKSRSITDLVEIRNLDFAYDTVKVEVEINGATYHYDLGQIGKMRQSLDITRDIDFDNDDRPVFDSIHRRAVRYMNEIHASLYKSSNK